MKSSLPSDWRRHRLNDPDVCLINPSKAEVRHLPQETQVTFAPMAAFDEVTGTIARPSVRPFGEVRKGYTYFAENDVVVAKITPCMENGKAAVARDLINGVGFGTTELHVLRPGPTISPDWLYLFVRSRETREAARSSMRGGAGQQRVPEEFFEQCEVVAPSSIAEQERIAAKVKALLNGFLQLTEKAEWSVQATRRSLPVVYQRITAAAPVLPLQQVAHLERRSVAVRSEVEYQELGVRSFGKGTFQKTIVTGAQLGAKRVYWMRTGDLVFNNVFAWEGAVAVVRPEDDGLIGSHRFITYVPIKGQAVSEFLYYHFLTPQGLADLGSASPGSAGRNRTLGLEKLKRIALPVPSYDEQCWFKELLDRQQHVAVLGTSISDGFAAFHDAVVARAFRGEL